MSAARVNVVGLAKPQLVERVKELGLPGYRAAQLWHWIYKRGAKDFSEMHNVSKVHKALLDDAFAIEYGRATSDDVGEDGTRKWLVGWTPADGSVPKPTSNAAETVFIPEAKRGTLCVSSQVGCSMACSFCRTGTQRSMRNLKSSEIVGQVMLARDTLGDFPIGDMRAVSHIVMMGQGEPLLNYRQVSTAIRIMVDPEGLSIGKRNITLSTCGVVPLIKRCADELDVNMAISLHAVNDELRDVLVPINKQYPVKDLLDECRKLDRFRNSRKLTFEYVMLRGVNDSQAEARELVRILHGIPALVNLIPFNPWPGSIYETSSHDTILDFAETLEKRGLKATIRWPRGRDISAACGQLKSETDMGTAVDVDNVGGSAAAPV